MATLVTGVSVIGCHTARLLAERGEAVLLMDLRPSRQAIGMPPSSAPGAVLAPPPLGGYCRPWQGLRHVAGCRSSTIPMGSGRGARNSSTHATVRRPTWPGEMRPAPHRNRAGPTAQLRRFRGCRTASDIDAAARELAWRPTYSLTESIACFAPFCIGTKP